MPLLKATVNGEINERFHISIQLIFVERFFDVMHFWCRAEEYDWRLLIDVGCFLIDFSAMGCLYLLVSEKNNELVPLQIIYSQVLSRSCTIIVFISHHTHFHPSLQIFYTLPIANMWKLSLEIICFHFDFQFILIQYGFPIPFSRFSFPDLNFRIFLER